MQMQVIPIDQSPDNACSSAQTVSHGGGATYFAKSNVEAKDCTMVVAPLRLTWALIFLHDTDIFLKSPIFYCDNLNALSLSTNPLC